jgi:hypothetical protein
MVFFLVALALGILVSIWPHERMHEIVAITRFFEVMIPVLAVGALLKYLCCGSGACDYDTGKKNID